MKLTYFMMPENTLGRNTVISLLFDDGTRLRNTDSKDQNGVVMSAKNARGKVGEYSEVTCSFGNAFSGRVITGIEIGYEGNGTGNFAVYFDHILIEDGEDVAIDMQGTFARTDVDGYIDFTGTYNTERGIGLVSFTEEGQEGYTYKKKEKGSNCLVIPATKYAYFKTDTSCVDGSDEELRIGVTYLDNTTGAIVLEYNAIEGTQNTKNPNYARVSVQGTNTGEWKTVEFEISNANFRKAQNNGADFRVSNYEKGAIIKDIYIIK